MTTNRTPAEALTFAAKCVGSGAALGRLLGVSQRAAWRWLNETKELPAEHVLTVERETGVSRHDLRPDLYPRDDTAPAGLATAR